MDYETRLLAKQIVSEVHAWYKLSVVNHEVDCDSYRVEVNDCVRRHQLIEAIRDGKLLMHTEAALTGEGDEFDDQLYFLKPHNTFSRYMEQATSFVVSNDWAGVVSLASLQAEAGEGPVMYRLPYDVCCFEFMVSGKPMLILLMQEDEENVRASVVVKLHTGWYLFHEKLIDAQLHAFLVGQVTAACVALEAEVAEREVVRAPEKLNRKRAAKGAVPLPTYHRVGLARRYRATRDPNYEPQHTGRGRRLHFRRGHWRHYHDHKTWIKWQLVGNPDLGVIVKDYDL